MANRPRSAPPRQGTGRGQRGFMGPIQRGDAECSLSECSRLLQALGELITQVKHVNLCRRVNDFVYIARRSILVRLGGLIFIHDVND